MFFANEIIFTTDFERNYSKKLFPFISKRFHTIKILSNIKAVKDLHKWEDRKYDLMYFGHIRPSKGLEDVFQVVLDLQRAKTVKVAIVGQVLSEFESYFTDLKGKYKEVIIDYYLNETSDLVSCLLNNAKIVFYLFPMAFRSAEDLF